MKPNMNKRTKQYILIGSLVVLSLCFCLFLWMSQTGDSQQTAVAKKDVITEKKTADKIEDKTKDKAKDTKKDSDKKESQKTEKEVTPSDDATKNTTEKKKDTSTVEKKASSENKKNNTTTKPKDDTKDTPSKGETAKPKDETTNTKPKEEPVVKPQEKKYVTLSIDTLNALAHMDMIDASVKRFVPTSGYFLSSLRVEYMEGESVYDLLKRICTQQGIDLISDSGYVRYIGNIGEFDAGRSSGWMYVVNGSTPSVGSASYSLQEGDVIQWRFTVYQGDV